MTGKILVVGAGGIGCELLKDLVLSDFHDIHVIDLDTIDISNLNRQFLFRKVHVGKPKSVVASEAVKKFNPTLNITPYHKSIFDSQFSQSFYRQFDIVFSALDNHSARKHLNRMCLAAKVDLVESGTAGYQGQVEPFIFSDPENRSNCYECKSRDSGQKTYPTCTIRNTPSEPVHCVVWSKNLFVHLFGKPDEDDEGFAPDFKDPELKGAPEEAMHNEKPKSYNIWESLGDWDSLETLDEKIAAKVWNSDIKVLRNMSTLWQKNKSRKEPIYLEVDQINKAKQIKEFLVDKSVLRDHQVVDLDHWVHLFLDTCRRLRERVGISSDDKVKKENLLWDKDDVDCMEFVASASVIRCHLFHIEKGFKLNIFDIKQIAGAIIPAIATTNAIVAGVMVLQAKKILKKKKPVSEVYLKMLKNVIEPSRIKGPNPECWICSKGSTSAVHMVFIKDPNSYTLGEFCEDILIKIMGLSEPEIYHVKNGTIIYSADPEDGLEGNLKKTFKDFDISLEESVLRCEDARQDLQILINLHDISDKFDQLTDKLNFIHCNNLMATNEAEVDSFDKVHENLRWILVREGTEKLNLAQLENVGQKRVENEKTKSPSPKKARINPEDYIIV